MPREYGAPQQIQPEKLADYLDAMSRSVFQSGISWSVIDAKWAGTRQALHDFDPDWLLSLTPDDVDALATDTRLIRNRRKIDAVIANAARAVDLDRQHGSFRNYLKSHGGFEATVADLRQQFKFMGDSGAFIFLYVVGEPVPEYEDWLQSRGRPTH